jgi:hypothetical protein
MTIKRIQDRLNLLKKLITAIREAKTAGIKDPLKVLRKSLKNRVDFKTRKSQLNQKKPPKH